MGIVRNNVNIEGIISEEDIPGEIKGQIIRYSEIETLYIPQEKPEVKNIFEIYIVLELSSNRMIKASFANIFIIDGIKKYKVVYSENTEAEKVTILELQAPYNTFIELPKAVENIWDIKTYILDAYFEVLDKRKIYGHFVYLLDIHYDQKSIRNNLKKITCDDSLPTTKNFFKGAETINILFDEISIDIDKISRENTDAFVDIDEEML